MITPSTLLRDIPFTVLVLFFNSGHMFTLSALLKDIPFTVVLWFVQGRLLKDPSPWDFHGRILQIQGYPCIVKAEYKTRES